MHFSFIFLFVNFSVVTNGKDRSVSLFANKQLKVMIYYNRKIRQYFPIFRIYLNITIANFTYNKCGFSSRL